MNGAGVHVDALIPKLNECRQRSLVRIFEETPPRLRISMALAFCEWTYEEWSNEAGITPKTVCQWVRGLNRIPFGAAIRLARVIGADPMQLFQYQLEQDASSPKLHTKLGRPPGVKPPALALSMDSSRN